jgi:uncharacterized protein (DUF58 family)
MAIARTTAGRTYKYLRVQDLRRLRHLFFASRRKVEGHLTGRHSSRQRGHSIEFNDYRQYMPGDELGDVDWKAYGRSDKLFIKLYEHETDMTVNLLVDGSASMAYSGWSGKKGLSKYDQACHLAAGIAFLTIKQRDRVAFAIASNGLSNLHRPYASMTHLTGILDVMESIKPAGEADLPNAIHSLARAIGRRGLLIVISDLLDDRDDVMQALNVYVSRGNEVILFHVLHQDEIELPKTPSGLFIDSESHAKVKLTIDDIRSDYEAKLKAFLDRWSDACKSRGIDYNLVSTSEHYYKSLEKYLFRRSVRR